RAGDAARGAEGLSAGARSPHARLGRGDLQSPRARPVPGEELPGPGVTRLRALAHPRRQGHRRGTPPSWSRRAGVRGGPVDDPDRPASRGLRGIDREEGRHRRPDPGHPHRSSRRAMSPPAEDGTVLDSVRRGDARALEELYRRHSPRLYALLLRMLRETADAEEILQETFVDAWRP